MQVPLAWQKSKTERPEFIERLLQASSGAAFLNSAQQNSQGRDPNGMASGRVKET